MDPVSAMATASAAFGAIKKGFQIGRDIESMASDLSRWMGAMSDLDMLEKEAKNPPIFKKLFAGKSVEQEAIETFAAKQKAESMRKELKDYISVMYGPSKWQEILEIEAQLRKQKREHEHRQMEIKQTIIEWGAGLGLFFLCVGALFGFVWVGTR